MPRRASRFRASQLIDGNVTNARDESLGDVQDLVLARDNRIIAYAVVAFGGFLGMGAKLFAMPWRLIKVSRQPSGTEPRLHLAVDQEVLKTAPGFDKDMWPDMADMNWAHQVDDYYSSRGITSGGATMSSTAATYLARARSGDNLGQDPDSEAFHYRRVSQLLGMHVVDANRETIAKLDDLIMDAESAQIEGAALSFGGFMGMGKHLALVPLESLALDRVKGAFVFPCTPADLEAMALPGDEWPGLDSDDWLARGRHQCARVKTARSGQNSVDTSEA